MMIKMPQKKQSKRDLEATKAALHNQKMDSRKILQ